MADALRKSQGPVLLALSAASAGLRKSRRGRGGKIPVVGMALRRGEETRGWLWISREEGEPEFGAGDEALVALASIQAVNLIADSRGLDTPRSNSTDGAVEAERERLDQLSVALSAELGLERVLEKAINACAELVNAPLWRAGRLRRRRGHRDAPHDRADESEARQDGGPAGGAEGSPV